MAACTQAQRNLTNIRTSKDEGVENLARTLVVSLDVAGEFVVRIGRVHTQAFQIRIAPHPVFVVEVIPASGRNTEAMVFFVNHVELGKDIDAVGHHIALVA
ncbi:hypothetical protein D3C84_874820 [compost metagenome]